MCIMYQAPTFIECAMQVNKRLAEDRQQKIVSVQRERERGQYHALTKQPRWMIFCVKLRFMSGSHSLSS